MARKPPQDGTKRTADAPVRLVPREERPTPTPSRRFRLNTMSGVRRELAGVYREARQGGLDLAAACKLGYLLSTLARVSEAEALEARLERLEQELRKRGNE